MRANAALEHERAELGERLRSRRPEIEEAALTRIRAVSDPAELGDPEYVAGLRLAVSAAIEYGLAVLEQGEERAPPVPAALLGQARVAARTGVSLDTVLRRYFAGYTLLGDFVVEEAERGILSGTTALKQVLRTQAALFDRLVAAVSEEHTREAQGLHDTSEQRRARRIQRLLDGELLDTSGLAAELAYEFEGFHLGSIAVGPTAVETLRELAGGLDCRLLLARRAEGQAWAWLGSRRRVDPTRLGALLSSGSPPLAIGEPGQGLAGWRLTHRQAKAALPIALREAEGSVRYADVALLASMLQDEVLTTSLRRLYLAPLEQERDAGETARRTLRAYFCADRNVSSAAAALGVSRQAIAKRLRAVEERLGCPLSDCGLELEATLRLDELDRLAGDNKSQPPQGSASHIDSSESRPD